MTIEVNYNTTSVYIDYAINDIYVDVSYDTITVSGGGSTAPTTVTSSSDTSQVISSGKFIKWVTVKNASGLSGFKIGTTSGGEEIAVAQAITAGVETTISVLAGSDSGLTMYFGGITSSTTIKIYTE